MNLGRTISRMNFGGGILPEGIPGAVVIAAQEIGSSDVSGTTLTFPLTNPGGDNLTMMVLAAAAGPTAGALDFATYGGQPVFTFRQKNVPAGGRGTAVCIRPGSIPAGLNNVEVVWDTVMDDRYAIAFLLANAEQPFTQNNSGGEGTGTVASLTDFDLDIAPDDFMAMLSAWPAASAPITPENDVFDSRTVGSMTVMVDGRPITNDDAATINPEHTAAVSGTWSSIAGAIAYQPITNIFTPAFVEAFA